MNTKEQFEAWFENDVVGEEVTFPEFDGGEYTEGDLYDDQLYFMLQAMWMAWQSASKASEQQLTESRREFTAANATIQNLELKVAQVVAENAGLINSSVCTLQDSRPPHGFYASEWFIAKLKNGEYAALKALPEEYSYDYCTNDGTYYTNDWVVGWMQTPDTEYRQNFKTPATDAFLAEVRNHARNEGINYAASRLAAAFNHGFVDKPLAEVYDVVRMILTTKEDLANDPAADGLSGEYAEKSLVEFAAQLRQGSEQ